MISNGWPGAFICTKPLEAHKIISIAHSAAQQDFLWDCELGGFKLLPRSCRGSVGSLLSNSSPECFKFSFKLFISEAGRVGALGIDQNNSIPSKLWNFSSSLKQDAFQIK